MLTDMHKKSKLKKLLHIITGEVKQMPSEMPLWLQEIPNIGTCLGGEGVRIISDAQFQKRGRQGMTPAFSVIFCWLG